MENLNVEPPVPESGAAEKLLADIRRYRKSASIVVLALTLLAFLAATIIADSADRRNIEKELQERATAIAGKIDARLWSYTAALETITQSYSLREDFNLERLEAEARRVGELFGDWFVLTTGGDTMQQLMNTLNADALRPPHRPRSDYPEVMRAEAESLRLGTSVVSDAFRGRIVDELVVSVVSVLFPELDASPVLNFAVTLQEITGWLEEADLDDNHFASLSDGARRVIARSQDNEDFLLVDLPFWQIDFSEGRNRGVGVGPPAGGGKARLFAMQRLEVAPGWTLAVSRPLPLPFEAAYKSAWPALSALIVMLLGSVGAALLVDRRRNGIEIMRAAGEAVERQILLDEVLAADSRKGRLMAVLAHDLRTPLVAVLGALDLMQNDKDKASRELMMTRVKRDGHGMLQLIDDVLELARLGSGEARVRPEPLKPAALLDDVANLVRRQAGLKDTEIVVKADAVPVLLGDAMALRRILMNFSTNAVRATRGGSIRLAANLDRVGPEGHTMTFSVSDTGCGIAATDIPRLFRDFGMLERDNASVEGTGLGLAICRRLATAIGAQVGVESTIDKGSRFWLQVTLPKADDIPVFGNPENNSLAVLAGLRVLVVEDHDTIRQITCAQLARLGVLPTEAADGDIAVALAETEEFDLILMDLRMQRLDGDKAAARIRSSAGPSSKARIIGLSAHQPPEMAILLSDLAFDACLQKPFDPRQLAALLRRIAKPKPTLDPNEDFDTENLEFLWEIDGGVLLTQALKIYSADIDSSRTKLAALIAERNTAEAGSLAHRLAGSSDILGARTVSAKLREFEALIEAGRIEDLDAAFVGLEQAMIRTGTRLVELIALGGKVEITGEGLSL